MGKIWMLGEKLKENRYVLILAIIFIVFIVGSVVGVVNGRLLVMQVEKIESVSFSIDLSQVKNEIVYDQEKEHTYCLSGYAIFNISSEEVFENYVINGVSKSSVGKKRFALVDCFDSDIAELHTHPSGDCFASKLDIEHWKNEARKGMTLFLIQCAKDKIVAYNTDDYSRGYWI